MSEKQLGVGPFVCEWCGEIFKSLKGTRVEDGTIVGVGYCQKCKCDTWTKPIDVLLGEIKMSKLTIEIYKVINVGNCKER